MPDAIQHNSSESWLSYLLKAAVVGLALAFVAVVVKPSLLERSLTDSSVSYAEAVAAAAPAVVYIYTTKPVAVADVDLQLNRRIMTRREVANNLGSGVIIRKDGLIVTNEHLLRGGQNIYVVLQDGTALPAEILGIDPDTDLALLDINADNLPAITLSDPNDLKIGDVVLAIGNAFGIGQTVTQGIVSAINRDDLNLNRIERFVQTDASINPGNSGGALVDTRGRLVAINSAVINPAGSEGIGFAIPVDLVSEVSEQLLTHGRVIRGWLGLAARPVAPHLIKQLGIERGGIVITAIQPGSPAAMAELQPGDIIVAVDGRPVPRVKDAINRVANLKPGTEVSLRILRSGGGVVDSKIRVIEQPAPLGNQER